ncbi:MAG: pitrilysin family protein, partial [Gemmatimonadota bacterium]
MRRALLFSALFLGSVAALGAQETPGEGLPVQDHTLENGLRLLILPRTGAPTVSFVVQYPIGSVNERPGITGIAHLLEHLFFKGTTTIGTRNHEGEVPLLEEMDLLHDTVLMVREAESPDSIRIGALNRRIHTLERRASELAVSNEFDAILTENGARSLNAITTTESTTYFVELPSNRAELWFVLESDRMRNPVFREFYTERDVVAEERRLRLENNPSGLLYEALLAEAFKVHPYGRPVVGSMKDIQGLSRRDVQDYFRRFYGPNNAVVSIVGDVDPGQILRWARKYLGAIPQGPPAPQVVIQEPEQTG